MIILWMMSHLGEVSWKGDEDPVTLACTGTMPQIFAKVNWQLKAIAVSGEPDGPALEKLSGSVLGHGHSTGRDVLSVKFRVNISPRKRGKVTGPDITRSSVGKLGQAVLTRILLLGVCNGQFDMLGIASPVLIKMRVAMRNLFIEENQLDWVHGGVSPGWAAGVWEMCQPRGGCH